MRGDARFPATLLFVAAVLACGRPSTTTSTQASPLPDPCRDAGTQAELTMCWGAEGQRAESDARAAFDRASSLLRDRKDAVALNALLKAETAWTSYRDAHCAAAAAVYEHGSLGPMQQARCRAALAREHRRNLDSLLDVTR
jgi:uncharacterized protein YecT (DUF1311 family)